MTRLGMLIEYWLSNYPNSNQSSNLKIKNRYSNFFSSLPKMPISATAARVPVHNCVTHYTGAQTQCKKQMLVNTCSGTVWCCRKGHPQIGARLHSDVGVSHCMRRGQLATLQGRRLLTRHRRRTVSMTNVVSLRNTSINRALITKKWV